MSTGADTKASTRELVREVAGLLERLQRRVALETLCHRGSSFGTEPVEIKTTGVGFGGWWRAVSAGADTKASNGSGALKIRDLRLLEDGSECGGALVSDAIVDETAKHGRGPAGERPVVSMGADTNANSLWRWLTPGW